MKIIDVRVKDEWSPNLLYSRKFIAAIAGISTSLFFLVWLAPSAYSHYNVIHYPAWHTLMECFSVAVSASIFSIMWQAHVVDETRYRVNLVSVAFLAVAVLDAAHMLSFKGMPDWITPSGMGKGIPFWFFARYAAAFALLALVLPVRKNISYKISTGMLLAIGFLYTAIPIFVVFNYPHVSSLFLVPGEGLTRLKVALEWMLIIILFLALLLNYKNDKSRFYDPSAIAIAIYLGMLSELCFTLYSNVTGVFSVLGHIYKIGAYMFLYQGIALTSLKLPFNSMAKSQELLKQITTNIKQIFLLTSINKSQIYYVSNAFEEITGRSVDSLIKNPKIWFDIIHPEDCAQVRDITENYKNVAFMHEFRVIATSGQIVWLAESIYPILEADGGVQRVASVCEDVTHKKHLQKALADSERLLSHVINSIPMVVGYWDKSLHNRFANTSYSSWFSYASFDLKGMHIKEVLGEYLYQQNYPHIQNVLQGFPQQFERKLTRPDGRVRHALVNYVPDIANGEVVGFVAALSDITSVKQSQDDLRLSEDRLLRSQAMGHIGSWEINVQTGQAWWSDENYRVYGVESSAKVDMHTSFDLVHPADRDVLLEVWALALANRGTFSHEHRIITPKNEIKYVWEFAEITLGADNRPSIIAGCTQDISERKRTEVERESLQGQLMQAQKMESIGHLTGGVAHDFNNMLGAMLGYTELLKQLLTSANIPNGRAEKYISEILTAGNRAKELISQMLMFSRFNPETQEEPPVILVQPIIKEVTNLLRSSIPSTISINYHVQEQSLRAKIHPVQLHQILLNLAINARDAIIEYGKIDITVTRAYSSGLCRSCHQNYSGEYLDFIVQDDGQGMSQEVIRKIFDPFFTTKEVGKGTGMGLSVVHGIVHSVGGHLGLSSDIDKGSAFHVFLPVTDSLTMGKSHDDRSAVHGETENPVNGMRILVVDDEKSITAFLQDLLSLHGAIITTFNNSAQALTAYMNNPYAYDLVITDETMPDLSGLDMSIAMLRKRKNLPVILCTGYSDKVNQSVAQENGLAGFMQKPLKVDDLIDLIRKVT